MLEVFTVGGGEYLVNTFNAVSAWTGGGGYRSMLQVVFIMGLIYSLLVVAFSLDYRAWFNWFLQATAIYMMLIVPTVSVKVTDRIDPGLAPAVVDNVPLGLGVMASFTSQFGDWMTRTAETVFVMPDALRMTNNGMIYGARLMEKAQTFQITDPVFRANLDEHFKQCVFYDVLLGFTPMESLTTSNNLWAAVGPGSPARAQKFLTRTGSGVDASIIRCDVAYATLDAQWAAEIDSDLPLFSKGAYPDLLDTVAAQRLRDDLGIVAGSMHGTSTNPYDYLKQVSTMDAFMSARESFSDAAWDAYAAQRADAQARNTYTSIAQQAMTWVPLLGIVLQVVFYAMFPVIFPLFLFPRTGITTLRGYGMGFFYLASWGPLYVILHMFVMNRAASAYAAVAPTGPTLLVSNGITAVNNDIATIAGFMMMSVPFLAAGMARGAMAIAGQATSMLAPAQSAAEAAAVERTTGNYAYGNTSFQNLTSNMRQSNKWDERPSYSNGYATSSFTQPDGGVENVFANGANAFDTRSAISSLAYRPTRTEGFTSDMREALAQGFNRAEGLRQAASEARSATVSTGSELLESATRSASSSNENGSGFNSSVSRMNDQVRSLTEGLSEKFSLSETDAERIARASILSADGTMSAGGSVGGKTGLPGGKAIEAAIGVDAAARLATQISSRHSAETGETLTADEALSRVADYSFREANSVQAKQARDDFTRATSSSSDSEVKSLSDRYSASLSDTRTFSNEASRTQEAFDRRSREFSEAASRGYSLQQDETQEFVTYAQQALREPENGLLASTGWSPGTVTATPEQEQVKQIMLQRFMDDRVDQVRQELGQSLPEMGRLSSDGPTINSAEGVQSFGEANMAAISARGPNISVRANSGDAAVRSDAAEQIGEGSFRLTTEGLALGNKVSAAEDRAEGLGEFVDKRASQSLGRTMPIISPILDGAEQRLNNAREFISGAGEWVGDKLGVGGASGGGPVNSVLPRSGEGFRTYSSAAKQYGTESVINELRSSSAEWAGRGGSPVNIGDVSKSGGGDVPGHQTHEQGRQVDIRPFRRDGSNAPTTWQSRTYDREQTRNYIEFMKERNPGATVLFNDPVLVREGLTKPSDGHDNHLHLSFPQKLGKN